MLRRSLVQSSAVLAEKEKSGESHGRRCTQQVLKQTKILLPGVLLLILVVCFIPFSSIERYYSEIQLGEKETPAWPQTTVRPSYKAVDIVDPTCSSLPDSVKELDFPLRTPHSQGTTLHDQPLLWIFDSGVKLRTQYLKSSQLSRFWRGPSTNYWETADEPIMMEAIRQLYARCQQEECVFIDGGAAYGYYSQLIRLHFPLVKVLAFNPHPRFCKQMLDNLALAQVKDVCLQQVGLSDQEGKGQIPYGTAGQLTDGQQHGNMVEVPVSTLDHYYDVFGNNKLVVFIKLDIEGHASRVIRGAPKMMATAQNVLVGLHNADERKACKGLETLGFNVSLPEHEGKTPNSLCFAKKSHLVD